jgi:tetratricopeptide (TPR) repeat protein
VNTEAYNLFLKAFNPYLTIDQAKSMLEQVIILDPRYADAYSYLASLWIFSGGHDAVFGREQVLEKAGPLLKKAIQLDKNSLIAHSSIASLRLYYYWDFESVEKQFQICNQLNPSNSDLISPFSDYLLASGKFTEAFILTKKAFDLNKNSEDNWAQMALAYYYDGQQEKTLETINTAGHLYPNNDFIFINSIRLLVYLEKYNKTIGLFEKSMADKQLNDIIPYYLGHLGIAYFKTGEKSKSSAYLNELLLRSRRSPVGSPSFFAAAVYSVMGENDKALQLLEKAYTDHEVEMYWLKVEPLFRPLHGDPRFENLLIKIGIK